MNSKHPKTPVIAKSSFVSSVLGLSATLPGVGAAMLPAVSCPACWPAYAGLLSSFGVGFIDYTPWLLPIVVVFLLITLASLFWQSYKRASYGPLVLGIVGTLVLALGKFQFESDITLYGGAVLLMAASLWNAWPRQSCQTSLDDPQCGCE